MTLVFFIGNNMQSFYMWFYVTMRPKVEIKMQFKLGKSLVNR